MEFIKNCCATFLAISLVYFGYVCISFFIIEDVSIITFLVGLVGWYILGDPSMDKWKQFFLDAWKGKE